jgi:transcriptional regulator of acetoin/glycerol metabolism
MMMHAVLAQLRALKLDGMATGLEGQPMSPTIAAMSFEERQTLLVDPEIHCRRDRKLLRLLKNAQRKYAQAAIENISNRAPRGLDRRAVMSLALGDRMTSEHSVLILGKTGTGKSWLACALPQIRVPPRLLGGLPAYAAPAGSCVSGMAVACSASDCFSLQRLMYWF